MRSQLWLTLCDPMDCSPQAPLSMEFSRQENWSGLPCPPPGDLPNPGTEPASLASPALAGRFFSTVWHLERTVMVLETKNTHCLRIHGNINQKTPAQTGAHFPGILGQ